VKVVFREYEYLAGHMENRELKSMPNTFFKRPGFNP
jgi:hypothetical protein